MVQDSSYFRKVCFCWALSLIVFIAHRNTVFYAGCAASAANYRRNCFGKTVNKLTKKLQPLEIAAGANILKVRVP